MRRALTLLLCWIAMLGAPMLHAAPKSPHFRFAVIGERASDGDATLMASIGHAGRNHSSFVVSHGIRPLKEVCGDAVFLRRVKLLESAEMPVVFSVAARDWAGCTNEKGVSVAQERLDFLRTAVFDRRQAHLAKGLPLLHQSTATKFRNYTENMRWEFSGVLFATVNLPSNNNNYLAAAGRNNEFEDRLVANRHWLHRIFVHARNHHLKGVVLFVDGNPLSSSAKPGRLGGRDGFVEIRRQITALTTKYSGRVLLVHGRQSSGNVVWRDNLGVVGIGKGAFEITVRPGATVMYSVRRSGNAH